MFEFENAPVVKISESELKVIKWNRYEHAGEEIDFVELEPGDVFWLGEYQNTFFRVLDRPHIENNLLTVEAREFQYSPKKFWKLFLRYPFRVTCSLLISLFRYCKARWRRS